MHQLEDIKVAIIGLGYVGLPLAIAFGKKRTVLGFDIKEERISQLRKAVDIQHEVHEEEFKQARYLSFTHDSGQLKDANCYIITVPTPIKKNNQPDLSPLIKASKLVGQYLKKNDIVIYESTVYPGATEEECVPILEDTSGLQFNHDFFCGYSPERINPGDKNRKIENIKKITSGSTPLIGKLIDSLYQEIIIAGTYLADSIKIAEAAKIIENTQRDINIAFINEITVFFNELGIDTESVLQAAESKWNFHPYRPGLVGGHCIGVDPYYLSFKSQTVGHYPELVNSARRINENMSRHIANQMIRAMVQKKISIAQSKILILGFTFKENCTDIRNTQVAKLVEVLRSFDCYVDILDPWANNEEVGKEYGYSLINHPQSGDYDGLIIAVGHDQFKQLDTQEMLGWVKDPHIIYDLKHVLPRHIVDIRL
ncbi:MAG: Vi polysaccharide biosynthesis protein VipA/TviB [Ferrovum sp. 37-45-19]|uniref:Vi polysaccharide biosynthesis UDP-N-acetylglucosamine C-6 dehydrogenase TviB n=1 Tax=Ferrovum sp. JA12 TaxID=1356299 RepID=UPI0007032286|nr:Vi polysaccharide biosynthesis UDP-N-acetylglucosamine C-6 dehydrogenase TviB [Ferrovum sp. JA12]OYV79892.1 MAG: Vi polysaccharide biosynthesis protein VipA/TviB [Ferrovum sp. 21-44-67]OYV95517.1 MAG: Vi polysaccharide biosynthesis protein VipA/TviB [Ferrovum sp. 37-45-19]OZB31560.1 MAG: Vi polysaccharide biosynthesis protein VipA/TviB [Ferrovum sp. 34-44-207]HQT81315.1 Vi polysaccharide biosynthesis UDP-N-acetylglucosamine C-6 dehydrogenase TviB [Ferrovaceae bacterium]KRH78203.1 UDP-N-acet